MPDGLPDGRMVTLALPLSVIEVRGHVDRSGAIPFRDWLVQLDVQARARVVTSLLRLELGNFSQTKSVGAGVSELRLDFGPGLRIYFGRDGTQPVILVGGGFRKRQQADIESAQRL